MTRMILAVCGRRHENVDGKGAGWNVCRYAYLDELQSEARIADENYVTVLVNRLGNQFDGDDTSSWTVGEKPPADVQRFFDIYLEVSNHGKENAKYAVDYHRYPGSPSQAMEDGMEIYTAIKKFGVRPSNKKVAANKRMLEAQRAAENARRRFEDGKRYWTEVKDGLGHVGREFIVYKSERFASKVRRYDNGDEYLNFKGKIFKAEHSAD